MSELIRGRRVTSGDVKDIKISEEGHVLIVLCGTQSDGTITPLLCNADGELVVDTGA